MLTHKKLEQLEKEYFLNLSKILENNLDLIEDRLTFLNKSKKYWEKSQKLDNVIFIGVQELVRYIIIKNFNDWKPFFLPVCSDTAFESNDSIINLDIKTVKNIDNDARQGYLQIRPNQVSYPNKPVNRIPWEAHQPRIIDIDGRKLYNFSFFVKFIWVRKQNDEIDIKEIVLCSIPNGLLSEKYGDDFLVNYKTYECEMSERSANLKKIGIIKERWSTSGINFVRLHNGSIWGKQKKKTKKYGNFWHGNFRGGTARFNIKKISQPKLTKGWNRIKVIKDKSKITLN